MDRAARDDRDQVVAFVIDTTERLPHVTEWSPRGVAEAQDCDEGGRQGASYGYERWAPHGSDPIADAEKIAAYWKSLGMRVRTTNADTEPTLFAEGGPVLMAVFDTAASEGSYSVEAVMPCGTGNAVDLNREDEARRDAGEVLLGDEGVVPWEAETPTPSPSEGK